MAGGVAGKIAGVHRDARPGQPLHVRHRRIVVFFGIVLLLFLQNAEDAARRGVPLRAGAHGRTADEDAVAIHVHDLLRDAHEHHEWTTWRELRLPPILARLERPSRLSSRRAFGVRRGFFNGLCHGEQGGGDGEDGEEFHERWCEKNGRPDLQQNPQRDGIGPSSHTGCEPFPRDQHWRASVRFGQRGAVENQKL